MEDPTEAPTAPVAIPLTEPRDGVPPVVETEEALQLTIAALARGTGPVAVDTERASGYKFSQRAYLVQVRREGSGTHLIDPIAFYDLEGVAEAIADEEWILHAASQDLACLKDAGMRPQRIFDSEVAGRLLGFERVSLGAMLENLMGVILAKEHSAADWSTRPLPAPWLQYAALDVELLIELREILVDLLTEAGKLDWAEQEFAATLAAPAPAPRQEPWRRVSGIHAAKGSRALAEVRALWETRDGIARRRDIAPGRILPDKAIMSAVLAAPANRDELMALPVFSGPRMRKQIDVWWKALSAARALPEDALPAAVAAKGEGPPSGRWQDRDLEAAARLQAARDGLIEIATQHSVQLETLIEPAIVRKAMWFAPADLAAFLTEAGARPWQLGLTLDVLQMALGAKAQPAKVDDQT